MISNDNSYQLNDSTRDSLYRLFICNYWVSPTVVDEFTNIDKTLYPYLLTNTHSNLLQCYQLSIKIVELETGFSLEDIKTSIKHMEDLGFIKYDNETKEILLLKFVRDNWTSSSRYLKGLSKQLNTIQSKSLIKELEKSITNSKYKIINSNNTLSIQYIKDNDTHNDMYDGGSDIRKKEIVKKNVEEERDLEKEIELELEKEKRRNSYKNLFINKELLKDSKKLVKISNRFNIDLNQLILEFQYLIDNNYVIDEDSGETVKTVQEYFEYKIHH